VSALLSLLGVETRSDADEFAIQREVWAGIFDCERYRGGYRAFCLVQVCEPITARTPAALGTAMAAARSARSVR
jgi:hypothetical protein